MTARAPRNTQLTCPECGWTSKRTTAGLAAYALRKHSCEKYRTEQATHARGAARRAAVDRTPKVCRHTRVHHEHGTYVAYTLDGCRCEPCAAAAKAYEDQRVRAHAYGRWDHLVDAGPAREHVARLREAGMGLRTIAGAAGVSHGALTKLVYGTTGRPPSARVSKANHQAILAVPIPTAFDVADAATVDGTGTRRRIESLIALGWSVNRLCAEHGLDRQALDAALRWQPVLARTARAVKTMAETIGDTAPPETTHRERIAASRARGRARANGWCVPAMWEDADVDDPYAEPPSREDDERPTVDLDEWAWLVRGRVDPTAAARRVGVTAANPIATIDKLARYHERADILALLSETRSAA